MHRGELQIRNAGKILCDGSEKTRKEAVVVVLEGEIFQRRQTREEVEVVVKLKRFVWSPRKSLVDYVGLEM
jgi:hypothetical protein